MLTLRAPPLCLDRLRSWLSPHRPHVVEEWPAATAAAEPLSATNTWPLGATRIGRGLSSPDANRLTWNPGGTDGYSVSARVATCTSFALYPAGGRRQIGRPDVTAQAWPVGPPIRERRFSFKKLGRVLRSRWRRGGARRTEHHRCAETRETGAVFFTAETRIWASAGGVNTPSYCDRDRTSVAIA
jgi:hypothetical protein